MTPDIGDCVERGQLKQDFKPTPTHQSRKVIPEENPPAYAWTENEDQDRQGTGSNHNSPGENRRLLDPPKVSSHKMKSDLQAGLTLGVWGASKKYTSKYPLTPKFETAKAKTKFQKRKEKLIAFLKPPYFILSTLVVMVLIHVWGSQELRTQLEWSPGAWWREPWRLITYGCVHANASHLAMNALVALVVGWPLEREQGWWRVVLVWSGGVAAGALGAGAFQPHVRVVGASAAVYALLTAHLSNVCLRFGHIPLWWFRPLSVVVLVISEGSWALLHSQAPEPVSAARLVRTPANGGSSVAWAAHAFGAGVGVPLAFIVFSGENGSKRHVMVCRVISGIFLMTSIILAAVHYSCFYEVDE